MQNIFSKLHLNRVLNTKGETLFQPLTLTNTIHKLASWKLIIQQQHCWSSSNLKKMVLEITHIYLALADKHQKVNFSAL